MKWMLLAICFVASLTSGAILLFWSAANFPGSNFLRTGVWAPPACAPHVVFTTFKCPGCTAQRMIIEDNVYYTLSTSFPRSRIAFFVPPDEAIEFNKFGVPVLASMYRFVMSSCPTSLTYTYVNGDILFTHDFLDTVDAVSRWFGPERDFLLVGRRTNVDWSHNTSARDPSFDFNHYFRKGELKHAGAADYFVVTRKAIDWGSIPPLVIGRMRYDSWLVDHVYHKENVALVDGTSTISALHQTDAEGNLAWGGRGVKPRKDLEYNKRFVKKVMPNRFVDGGKYRTKWEGGSVIVVENIVNKQSATESAKESAKESALNE